MRSLVGFHIGITLALFVHLQLVVSALAGSYLSRYGSWSSYCSCLFSSYYHYYSWFCYVCFLVLVLVPKMFWYVVLSLLPLLPLLVLLWLLLLLLLLSSCCRCRCRCCCCCCCCCCRCLCWCWWCSRRWLSQLKLCFAIFSYHFEREPVCWDALRWFCTETLPKTSQDIPLHAWRNYAERGRFRTVGPNLASFLRGLRVFLVKDVMRAIASQPAILSNLID